MHHVVDIEAAYMLGHGDRDSVVRDPAGGDEASILCAGRPPSPQVLSRPSQAVTGQDGRVTGQDRQSTTTLASK